VSRTFIIGDVHGCIDELQELKQILAPTDGDSVNFIGSLINRGANSFSVVRDAVHWSNRFNVRFDLGNRQKKFLRYVHCIKTASGLEREMKGINEFPDLESGIKEHGNRYRLCLWRVAQHSLNQR
jgi:hypothetical protein